MALLDNIGDFFHWLGDIDFELGQDRYLEAPRPSPLEDWIKLKPMRLKNPKTVGQFSRVLGAMGLGNRVDPRSHKDTMIEIHAITASGVNKHGEQVQHTCVLDPTWTDVTAGEIPWEDSQPKRRRRR